MTPEVLADARPGAADGRERSHGSNRRARPVAVEVALFESRRLLLHPLVLLGTFWYLALVVTTPEDRASSIYDAMTTGPTFFMGVFTYFAANLLASRPRRHHCLEHHASLPSAPTQRTAGLCLATLAPALVGLLIGVAALFWHSVVVDSLIVRPGVAEMAAGPLTIVGGGLLGVQVARWLPFPLAPIAVMVGMVAVNVWLNNQPETLQLLGTYASFARYSQSADWAGLHPGSAGWHAVYLAALCAMAATGALLPDARRKFLVLAVGAIFTVAAVLAGIAQLP